MRACRHDHDLLRALPLAEFHDITHAIVGAPAGGDLYLDDGAGGLLLLRNCPSCCSTISYPMQEETDAHRA